MPTPKPRPGQPEGVAARPLSANKQVRPDPGYRATSRPYVRGRAPKLVLCKKCECYFPPNHIC